MNEFSLRKKTNKYNHLLIMLNLFIKNTYNITKLNFNIINNIFKVKYRKWFDNVNTNTQNTFYSNKVVTKLNFNIKMIFFKYRKWSDNTKYVLLK